MWTELKQKPQQIQIKATGKQMGNTLIKATPISKTSQLDMLPPRCVVEQEIQPSQRRRNNALK